MKSRTDFVSNSSSCSFFIYLGDDGAVDAFKSVCKTLCDNYVTIKLYDDLESIYNYDYVTLNTEQNCASIHSGCYVNVDSGEDHDSQYMERYNNMVSILASTGFNFTKYADYEAHTTDGDDLPEIEENT